MDPELIAITAFDYHSDSVFSLFAANDNAAQVVRDERNRRFAYTTPDDDEPQALSIGTYIDTGSKTSLVTLGRSGDIIVEHNGISRRHCGFDINLQSGHILLSDFSSGRTTQVDGDSSTTVHFDPSRSPRRILVTPTLNLQFSFGPSSHRVEFNIVWHKVRASQSLVQAMQRRREEPRFAMTVNDTQTMPQSRMVTRIHTARKPHLIRYRKLQFIGSGTFGQVWDALNVDTGDELAVKIMSSKDRSCIKREIETLSRLIHPNIVEYRGSQDKPGEIELFMPLKECDCNALHASGYFKQPERLNDVLKSILEAVAFLHKNKVIHRDIKPANILCSRPSTPDKYLFQLSDFGQCNKINAVCLYTLMPGSPLYSAPELHYGQQYDEKVDVWALAITVLQLGDAFSLKTIDWWNKLRHDIQKLLQTHPWKALSKMLEEDPSRRADASQMIRALFTSEEKATPAHTIRTSERLRALAVPRAGTIVQAL